MAGLHLEILTSKVGFVDNPQNYIVGAKLSGIYDTWRFSQDEPTSTQAFNHFIKVSYSTVLPEDLLGGVVSTSGLLPKFPADLFYPLGI